MSVSSYIATGLPLQQLTLDEKRKNLDKFGVSDWEKMNLDGLEGIAKLQFYNNIKLKKNYDLLRGVFNYEDYIDDTDYNNITNAISQQLNMPSYMRHYDITTKAVNVLVGEFIKRPDIFRVKALDNYSFNELKEAKTEQLVSYFQGEVQKNIERKMLAQGIDPHKDKFNSEEEKAQYQEFIVKKQEELAPENIEKMFQTDFMTEAEKFGNAIIEIDRERFNLKEMEAKEFEDELAVDRCFRHFYLSSSGYGQERWNPIFTFHHISPQVENVEDGDYVGQFIYLSKAQIIDKFGWMMTKEQKECLYPRRDKFDLDKPLTLTNLANSGFNSSLLPFADYKDFKLQENLLGVNPHTGFPAGQGMYPSDVFNYDLNEIMSPGVSLNFNSGEYVQVVQGYWRSQMLIYKFNFLNPETGKVEPIIVDETFDFKALGIEEVETRFDDNDEPNTVVGTWKTQIWQGIKINLNYNAETELTKNALYIDVKPCALQLGDPLNEDRQKLPVIGNIFNNMNSKSTSLIDLIKPYQIFYNGIYNRAYDIGQREIGKFMLLDHSILPILKDWGGDESNFEKFTAIAKAFGVGLVNTKVGVGSGATTFAANNSYQIMDMDVSNEMQTKIMLAILIEDQCYKQIGIGRERLGAAQASQTATGAEQNLSNSYSQTESYFEKYYNYKKRCMNTNIEVAQQVYGDAKDLTLDYVLPDTSRAFITVNDEDLSLRKLGVYVVNSQELQRQLDTIRQLAINNNTTKLPMSALTKMAMLNSPREIIKELEYAEKINDRQIQAQQQHETELQQQQLQAASEEKDKERQFEATENQLDRENDIRKASIASLNFDQDVQNNGQLDSIEQGKLGIAQSKIDADIAHRNQENLTKQLDSFKKHKTEKEKIESTKQMQEKQLKMDKEQMKHQIKIEDEKLKQINAQSKNQEKLAKEKHDTDIALANKKIELEKLKLSKEKKTIGHEVEGSKDSLKTDKQINKIKVEEKKGLSKIKLNTAKIAAKNKIAKDKKTK